jgi:hypothetical protein
MTKPSEIVMYNIITNELFVVDWDVSIQLGAYCELELIYIGEL